jgi:hypothetical protein
MWIFCPVCDTPQQTIESPALITSGLELACAGCGQVIFRVVPVDPPVAQTTAETEIARLADFITTECPAEMSESQGAVDSAVHIINRLRALVEGPLPNPVTPSPTPRTPDAG